MKSTKKKKKKKKKKKEKKLAASCEGKKPKRNYRRQHCIEKDDETF